MHFALGLFFVLLGLAIATRRTRPRWWIVCVMVLAALGVVWSILSFTQLTYYLGYVAVNWIGWIYVALCAMTMLAAFLVLERRGADGEEQAAFIGDTIFDGDTDDSDDRPRTS